MCLFYLPEADEADDWILIHYFQPLGGASLRGAFKKL
jgi:hypothetical protein